MQSPAWPQWPLALTGLGLGLRLLTAAATRHRLMDAFFLPFSVLLMTVIAVQALVWQARGTGTWKGRNLHPNHQVADEDITAEYAEHAENLKK